MTVLANTAPTLGAYAAATLALAAGNTVPPSVPPSDNVSVLLGVAAPGFTGSLSVDSSTGVVTIANAGPAGAYTVTVTGTDNCAATTTANFALTVPMTLSPASLSGGTEGVAYGPVTITQTGGVGPTTFAVISGALPAGMTLSSSGILSGTPTAGGTFTFTVTATGTNSATGSQGYTLTVNGRPTISALPSQTIVVNGSTVVPFSIGDDFTAPSSLVVSVGSSNPGLMPSSGLVLGGSGSNRNLTLTPAAEEIGQATITLSVNDGTLTAGAAFVLTVQLPPPNQAPTIAGLGDASMEANTSNALAFTVGDNQTAPESLAVTATSSNEVLLLNNALTLSGSGSSRALTVTPAADRVGTTTLSVTVSDGKLTTTQTFVLAVVAASAPQAPTGLTASAAGTEIRFFWNAPAAGSAPTFYVLEGGTSPGTTTLPVVNTGSRATTWTVTLPPGTYFVRVRSGNGAGTSGPSNEISGSVQTTVALPGSPTGLSIAAAGTHLTTSWQRPSVGGTAAFWQIEVGTAPGQSDVAVFAIAGTSFSASGDLPPGQYVIRVRGQNAGGGLGRRATR